MFSKRTIIGTIVGGAIVGIGVYALILSFGIQTVNVDEKFGIGEKTVYQFPSPDGAHNNLKVTGESFDVMVQTPGNGLQVPKTPHKKEVSFDWYVLQDGINRIEIQNTGQSELYVTGTIERSSDPIWFTYHIMVIISGIVIIGFSAGFSLRKPRGF